MKIGKHEGNFKRKVTVNYTPSNAKGGKFAYPFSRLNVGEYFYVRPEFTAHNMTF